MKTPSNTLFLLIQSLSLKEHKCIKRFLRTYKHNQPELLTLFSIIANTDKPEDSSVKKKFLSKVKNKNYAYTKHLLYKEILSIFSYCQKRKQLTYHYEKEVEYIEIFLHKNLVEEAYKRIQKLKNKLTSIEEFELLLKIIHLELIYYPLLHTFIPDKHQIFEQATEYLSILLQKWQYRKFYSSLNSYIRTRNYREAEKLFQAFSSHFPTYPSKYISLQISHLNFLKNYLEFVEKNEEQLSHIYNKLIQIFSHTDWLQIKNPMALPFLYASYVATLTRLRKWANALQVFKQFHATLQTNAKQFVVEKKILLMRARMRIMYRTGITYTIDETLRLAVELSQKFHRNTPAPLFLEIALLYFLKQDFPNALNWLDKYLAFLENQKLMFLKIQVLFLRFIFLYENKFFDLLPYALKTTYNFVKQFSCIKPGEKMLLSLFQNIVKTPEKELIHYFPYQESFAQNPQLQKDLQNLFDIDLWILSKLNNTTTTKLKQAQIPASLKQEIMNLLGNTL